MKKCIKNEIVALRQSYDMVIETIQKEGITLEIGYPDNFSHFLEVVEELIEKRKSGSSWVDSNQRTNNNYVPAYWYGECSPKVGTLRILSYLPRPVQKRLGLDGMCY